MDNITVLVIIVLFFSCCYLGFKIKKLEDIIEGLKRSNKDEYEKNIFKEDIMSINDISQGVQREKVEEHKIVEDKVVTLNKENSSVNNSSNGIVVDEKKNDESRIKKELCNNFDVDDFIKKDKIYRKLDSNKMNKDYLLNVSKELESSMEPQTIQLTAYEQEQEDNAIISYKELLNVNKNEKIVNDGTVEFIEELKKFRNNLGK